MQISTFSQYALAAMKARMKIGPLNLEPLARPAVSRLMVAWGGLHSEYSDKFSIRLLRAHQHGRPILKLTAHPTPATHRIARRSITELSKELRSVGVRVLTPGAIIGPPGSGFHFGASLPMRTNPSEPFETNSYGQLACWKNVHVIDSSLFPTIPATTMVLTIMANAWRITKSANL